MTSPADTVRAYLESIDDGVRVWDEETRAILHDQVVRLTMLATDVADVSAAEEGRIPLEGIASGFEASIPPGLIPPISAQ